MTNEGIKQVANELSFNVGWENIRVLVTFPSDTDLLEIDPAFNKDQILNWLKGNGQEPSILIADCEVEVFGIISAPLNETEPIIRMIGHDKG